jgi:uncharacterized membrane protein YcaP (DUF421 family)
MFMPTVSPLEIVIRGTLVYLSLFVLLRVVLKRQAGTFGITDMLLVVLIADAAQNAMSGEYKSIGDGVLLVATLIFWSYVLDMLAHKSRLIEQFTYPAPLKLVENGKLLRRNMRREFITEAELMSQIREKGVDQLTDVRAAFMEGDGQISVIKVEEEVEESAHKRKGVS